jgi:CRP-like cAMP-binding protein
VRFLQTCLFVALSKQKEYNAMTEQGYIISNNNPNVRYYQPNITIIQENAPDDGCVYILESGTIGVFRDGNQIAEVNEPGSIFGEMASLLGTNRTATVKTMTECRVTVYKGDLRKSIIELLPPVAQKIVLAITQKLQRQTALHAEDLLRISHLQQMNQQLRRQVSDLTQQLEELKAAQADSTKGTKKSKRLSKPKP